MSTQPRAFRPHPQVVFTRMNDREGVLLSLVTSRYYTLNESGTTLWEALRGGTSPGRLAEALQEDYEVTREEAVRVVDEFLEVLGEERLIEQEPLERR